MTEFQKEIYVDHKYLHLPICNGSAKVVFQLICDDMVVREFDVELAIIGRRDWWAFYDISEFDGKNILIRTMNSNMAEAQAELLDQVITQSNDLLYIQGLYNERYRPQFHFTPKRGWNNDPNGLVYYHGTWHLFFQHNPFGITWGSMHWGHATSSDLLHWIEKPVALYPSSMDDMAFSGGAIIDTTNTSGFKNGENDPIILEFTSTGRGECLAYSVDNGKSFQEFTGNPVLDHRGRDPKIIRYQPLNKWVMIVYDEKKDQRGYDIYTSDNLKEWVWLQHLPGWFECPEFFQLSVEGSVSPDPKWLVYGSLYEKERSAFQVGDFDGINFTSETETQIGHAGPHFYAAQVFSNAPDDRKIMLGWLAGADYPGMPFGHGMTVPLELSLREIHGVVRLCFYPAKEINLLRTKSHKAKNLSVTQANEFLSNFSSELMDIEIAIDVRNNEPFRVDIGGYPVQFDPDSGKVSFAGKSVDTQPGQDDLHLRILIDRSVTEVFVDQGWGAFSSMTVFDDLACKACIEGEIHINSLEVYILNSTWFSN